MPKEQLTSVTATLTPIITALVEAENILGPNRNWKAVDQTQTIFLDRYFSRRTEIEKALADTSSETTFKSR